MKKEQLMQHRALEREERRLKTEIDKLYDKLENVPVVLGKVKGSSKDFPYIEKRMTVQMAEPMSAERNVQQLLEKKKRLAIVRKKKEEIERFISEIADTTTRQIFEMAFLEGKKQEEIGEEIGYSQGRVSQIIRKNLKD